MRKQFLLMLGIVFLSFSAMAQHAISLQLNHSLSDLDFKVNQKSINNLNNEFIVTRLQYYISEISIIHDGGVETVMNDVRLLVHPEKGGYSLYEFGSYDITNIEKIKWHIGIEEAVNHGDPSIYSDPNPLAPSFPSMHWGWSAGYRFLAIEGTGGNSDAEFQLHGLGDKNYVETIVDYQATAFDNELRIIIHADYSRILENIELNGGVIEHGENGKAQTAIMNMRDYVFSKALNASGTLDDQFTPSFMMYPNPSTNGSVRINLSTDITSGTILVSDVLGRTTQRVLIQGNELTELSKLDSGLHFISLYIEGELKYYQKLIVE